CCNSCLTECTITHRRNIKYAKAIRLAALTITDHRPQIMIVDMTRENGMRCPFISYRLGIGLHAESHSFQFVFGPLVHDRTLPPVDRSCFRIGFPKVLSHLEKYNFEKVP